MGDRLPRANNNSSSSSHQVGELGEYLVAAWLHSRNWHILSQRWRCRWGEIDLIAYQNNPSPKVAFVEVKTRRHRNWDAGGLLSITPSKQAKLWQTAELFLQSHADLAEVPCRFDVALVSCQPMSSGSRFSRSHTIEGQPINLGQPLIVEGYQLILQDYIESAFN